MLKRSLAILLCTITLFAFTLDVYSGDVPSVSAKSAVLMEADSKAVVYEKNAYEHLPMASTTKIMTALITLEKCDLSHRFRVSDTAIGTEGTSAYLQKGDTMTIEGALYALLLQSANDVAVALALEVGGSIEGFAELMNKKAKELLLKDTAFKNPSGLPEEGHYTTARDRALLGAICMENPDFSRIVSTKTAVVDISGKERTFVNHNKLLSLYDGAIGIKTGFTKESGRCLVGACERDGVRFVSVTLSASDDWNDHKALFDYGFRSYHSYTLYADGEFTVALPIGGKSTYIYAAPKGEMSVTLKKGSKIEVKIEAPSLITAPVKRNDTVGYALFCSEGKVLHKAPLKALSNID